MPTVTATADCTAEAKEPGAIAGDTDDPDAPNLFGRACSPEDGQDSSPVSSAGPAAAAATGVSKSVAVPTAEEMLPLAVGLESAAVTPRQRDDLVAPPLVPGERTRQVVEKMVRHVTEHGKVFEDRVRRFVNLWFSSLWRWRDEQALLSFVRCLYVLFRCVCCVVLHWVVAVPPGTCRRVLTIYRMTSSTAISCERRTSLRSPHVVKKEVKLRHVAVPCVCLCISSLLQSDARLSYSAQEKPPTW